jgi:hypothetical protein
VICSTTAAICRTRSARTKRRLTTIRSSIVAATPPTRRCRLIRNARARSAGSERDAWHRKRLTSDLRFASTFSDRKEAAQVQSNAAAGLFEAGDLATAISAAEGVTRDPKADNESRRVSWRVIGHAAFDKQDYARAEAAYLQVQKLSPPGSAPDKDISERLAAAIYRQGEKAQAAGQSQAAADHFSRVAAEAPDTQIRVTADYDAAMATLKAGKPAAAIPMLLAFRDKHAGEPLAADVTKTLAATYEKNGQPREAAAELQRISDTPSSDPQLQREALWHSAELLMPLDKNAGARALRQYVERYPTPFDTAIEAYQKLIDIAATDNDPDIKNEWSRRLVNFEATGGSSRTARSRALAARASLIPAQQARDAFIAVELKLPLKASLAAKRKRLEDALAAYGRSADYGVAEVLTQATFETAELYHELARALKTVGAPARSGRSRARAVRPVARRADLPVRGQGDLDTRSQCQASRQRRPVRQSGCKSSYAELAGLSPGRYGKSELPETSVPIAANGTQVSPGVQQSYDSGRRQPRCAQSYAAAESRRSKRWRKTIRRCRARWSNLALAYQADELIRPTRRAALKKAAEQRSAISRRRSISSACGCAGAASFVDADAAQAARDRRRCKSYRCRALRPRCAQRSSTCSGRPQALSEYEQYQSLLPAPDPQVARVDRRPASPQQRAGRSVKWRHAMKSPMKFPRRRESDDATAPDSRLRGNDSKLLCVPR